MTALKRNLGKKRWIIPDCERPPEGEGALRGHESVIVVNDSDQDAEIRVKLLFTDRESVCDIVWKVGAHRVKCFRTNSVEDMYNAVVPEGEQYAMTLESDTSIVVQYGRLDNRQSNLAFYTTLGYAEE